MINFTSITQFGASPFLDCNTAQIQSTLDAGYKRVYVPDMIFNSKGGTLIAPVGCTLYGPGTIKSFVAATLALSDGCSVEDVTIDGEFALAPFWGISAEDVSNISISKAKLIRQRIVTRGTTSQLMENITVDRCKFDVDFTGTDYEVQQYDVCSFYGVKNPRFTNNAVDVVNVHRVLKISDNIAVASPNVSDYSSREIKITGNTINGVTTSGKQMCDLFAGSGDVIISDNHVNVSGFSVVFEDKSYLNAALNGSNPSRSLVMNGNVLKNNNAVIALQGTYGIEDVEYDGDRPSFTTITGNDFYSSSIDPNVVTVSARFQDSFILGNNTIRRAKVPMAAAVSISSNKISRVSGNSVSGGAVLITKSISNASGKVFSGAFSNASINGNDIYDYDASGGVVVQTVDVGGGNISINANTMTPSETGTQLRRAAYFNTVDISVLNFKDNVYDGGGVSSPTPIFTSYTAVKTDYEGNSWQ